MKKEIVIIGGGAGGGGAAARCRRLDENANITVYEKSGYASYSNCGLPYRFSGMVKTFSKLIMTSPEVLKTRYNLDVNVKHEVIEIDAKNKTVQVKNLHNNKVIEKKYDELIISAGAPAFIPPLPGVKGAHNVFSLKTPDDVAAVENFLERNIVKDIVVIGGGFIGAEIAENFQETGKYNVTVIDLADQLLARSVDKDFAAYIHKSTIKGGIKLMLNRSLKEVMANHVVLENGQQVPADLIFMTVGVKPELEMYKKIGLNIGTTGGIVVDNQQRTNIENIYAIGDIAETKDLEGKPTRVTLAFPASRQAVVAANTIYNYKDGKGKPDTYKGIPVASTLSMFNTTVASVGKTEKQLQQEGIKYNKTLNSRGDKIGALDGENILLKVLYDDDFNILGAQAAGPKTTEKRISYVSAAMQFGITYDKFEDFMVAYSPTVDTTYDPLTMGARLAKHQADGSLTSTFPQDLAQLVKQGYQIIDVREPNEWESGTIPGAKLMAMSTIRKEMHTLHKTGKYIIHCKSGARSYNTTLIFKAHGFKDVLNLAGGYSHYETWKEYASI